MRTEVKNVLPFESPYTSYLTSMDTISLSRAVCNEKIRVIPLKVKYISIQGQDDKHII